METIVTTHSLTLGDCAYQAIEKHFKKSIKHEAEVLKGKDPEALHQMRVGMRRLRTAMQTFAPVIKLPATLSIKNISKIAHTLGELRDLDVMKGELNERYRPHLKNKERHKLDDALTRLKQHRSYHQTQIEKTLDSDRYQTFKQGFTSWLKQPTYEAIASLPAWRMLPDILLPLISELLRHPGWLVGVEMKSGELQIVKSMDAKTLNQYLEKSGEVLHDLRKQMKRLRYQAEFFVDFYEATYQQRLEEFQSAQEILGHLQDHAVLGEFMKGAFDGNWQKELPTLVHHTQQAQVEAWQAWQPLQKQYLDWQFRAQLRHLIASPQAPSESPAHAIVGRRIPMD